MKVGIALHAFYSNAIDHFHRVANITQSYFQIEKIELTSEEEYELEARDLSEDLHEEEIEHKLFKMKIDHGYKPSDLFIAFFEGRLLDSKGAPYFIWTSDLEEDEDPGAALISLSYLKSESEVLDKDSSNLLALKSIESNLLYAITVMATSLEGHYETTGCVLDFCGNMDDINYSLMQGFVFCEQKRCKQLLEKSEAGQAILSIAEALNKNPIRLRTSISLMSRCFKTGIDECTKVNRVVPNQVFIGMPFRGHFEDVYNFGIKPVLDQMGYRSWKADDHPNIIDLMCKVCEGIQKSEFIIVDLSEWNPNVFFELGLSYALGRKVLIIKHKDFKIPTDLKGMEYIQYSSVTKLRQKLSKIIAKIFI